MVINLKTDIMNLLFSSGDIDNKKNRISKSILDKMETTENEILKEYKVNKKNHIIEEYCLERNLKFSEMIPASEDKNILVKAVVLNQEIEDITDEMLYIPLSELKLYSYIYMTFRKLTSTKLIVVFSNLTKQKIIKKEFEINYEESKMFFYDTIEKYLKWIDITTKWTNERNESIKPLKFPFKEYRAGQEKLARGIYSTIVKNKILFAQAPTGVGKTISSIFPAIKSIGENKIDKIFYLTAKTVGAKVAEESFDKMREQGLKFRNITLTAKDKVCFKPGASCNPESCEYAKDYYGKVNHVIFDMLTNETNFNREVIEKYAREYKVCPFELSLDLSLYSDSVICDYNYVFDPNVYLKRYFQAGNTCNCTFLIDEAHNLVDRARSMYSAEIDKKILIDSLEKSSMFFTNLESLIKEALKTLSKYEELCVNNEYFDKKFPSDLVNSIDKVNNELLYLFHNNRIKNNDDFNKFNELSNACSQFVKIAEMYDSEYVFFLEKREKTLFKLFCIDPSKNLKRCYKRGKSAIIFSATLSPMGYFRDVLGGDKESYGISLESPFDINNRELILVDNISTKYKDRERSYEQIVDYIYTTVSCKMGNYMIFAPSFDYMNKLKDIFNTKYPDIKTIKQETVMSELEREVYLSKFESKPKKTLVSFNVISGIFGEGIDFKGEKLIGSIIVGVGLPMICLERNIIKDYFQAKNGYGFDFAYTFPGLSKVIQSAGRVIRTDDDKGIIMLIDDRFGTYKYKSLLPKEWSNYKSVKDVDTCKNIITNFWKKE